MTTQERHGYISWNTNLMHLVISSSSRHSWKIRVDIASKFKDRQRRWICFKWFFEFLQDPWHTKTIHHMVYTSVERYCQKKEQNHHGDGTQHVGSQAFAKWILEWSSHNCCLHYELMSDKECEEQISSRIMYTYES